MIRSMTGFGRGEVSRGNRKFTVEIKAVNHRYYDVNIRMPRFLNQFDSAVRSVLKEYMQRGKVDVYISCEGEADGQIALTYNEALAAQYMDCFEKMRERFSIDNDVRVSTLARCPEVLTLENGQEDEEELWQELEQAVREACMAFTRAREREGEQLREDLLAKLEGMQKNVSLVEDRYPGVMEAYRERLREKMMEILDERQIDEARIAAELVIYSDKVCTDEETVRLRSHIETMAETLREGGAVGRRLDFIAQEMNREANTILSKANDLTTSNLAIELKTEIEKVREQIQNIE